MRKRASDFSEAFVNFQDLKERILATAQRDAEGGSQGRRLRLEAQVRVVPRRAEPECFLEVSLLMPTGTAVEVQVPPRLWKP